MTWAGLRDIESIPRVSPTGIGTVIYLAPCVVVAWFVAEVASRVLMDEMTLAFLGVVP